MLYGTGPFTTLLTNWNSLVAGKLFVLLIIAIIIFISTERNCSGLPQERHTFRLKGRKLQGVIVSLKLFLPALSAGRTELKPLIISVR